MNTSGRLYVYSIHAGLATNITTDPEYTGAVLIRAIEPLQGLDQMIHRRSRSGSKISKTWQRDDLTTLRSLTDGPSKLSEALGIQKSWNNTRVGKHLQLMNKTEQPVISSSPRIGISSSKDLPWRFYDRNSPFVSR
jgi:DNA-3-methyladenine glycosylase